MAKIHLIEKENLITPISGSQTEYESGYWALTEQEAGNLIGAHIYFHERQIAPSFYGGLITGFCIQQSEPYEGRIIFRFEPKAECRDVRAGVEGWHYEKKIVR